MRPITELDVFRFTCQLFWHLYPKTATSAADDPTYNALRQIADGETTLVPSPQEMSDVAAPERRAQVEAYLHRNIGKAIEHERSIAQLLLKQMNEPRS